MVQTTDLRDKDIKIVITVAHVFETLEEKLSTLRRNTEDVKKEPNQISRDKNATMSKMKHTG